MVDHYSGVRIYLRPMAKSHGGARTNAGRKPVADKKVALTIYPTQSEIESAGGMDAAKALALSAIRKKKKS